MFADIKVVFFSGLNLFFDFFEDPVRIQIIESIKSEALSIKQDAYNHYDEGYSDWVHSAHTPPNYKQELNRLVEVYNRKALEYNLKSYWYKQNLQPLPNWD